MLYHGPQAKAVISLTHTDFIIQQAGVNRVRVKKNKMRYPGVLKVYANWCGHCQDKEACIIEMARALEYSNMGLSVYVVDCADKEQKALTDALNIKGFPTFLNCAADGTLSEFAADTVYDVQSVLDAICPECRKQKDFASDCFKR